jgi:hypothetical protein
VQLGSAALAIMVGHWPAWHAVTAAKLHAKNWFNSNAPTVEPSTLCCVEHQICNTLNSDWSPIDYYLKYFDRRGQLGGSAKLGSGQPRSRTDAPVMHRYWLLHNNCSHSQLHQHRMPWAAYASCSSDSSRQSNRA